MLELAMEIMREIEARKGNLIGEVKRLEVIFSVSPFNERRPLEVVVFYQRGDNVGFVFLASDSAEELQQRKEYLFFILSKEGGPSLSDFDMQW